ncbi:UNVERIFIED_CONTAM: hypothetical protein GTU68_012042 [Idotea baltica]|nr:hypothetical protein [Idotea baltica]
MAIIRSFKGKRPQIENEVFIADNATIIGEVTIGKESSIWYQTVLRGDVGAILIGENTNIQDATIIHCTTGRNACKIGDGVTVGHRAILHGCTIESDVLIGMGATVLDDVLVPSQTIVAAGALIPQGKILESGFLYAGIPAKKIKPITPQQMAMIKFSAIHYVENGKEHSSLIDASDE